MLNVKGKINGKEISFKQGNVGAFTSIIPKDINTQYIVEIEVKDEAGNVSYRSSVLYFYDLKTYSWVTLNLRYLCNVASNRFYINELHLNYYYSIMTSSLSVQQLKDRFSFERMCYSV